MTRQPSYRYRWPLALSRPTEGTSRPFWTITDLRWAHPNAESRGAVLELLTDSGWVKAQQ